MGSHKCGFPPSGKKLADAGATEVAAMRPFRPPWRLQWNRLNALGRLALGIRCRVSNPDRVSDALGGDLTARPSVGTSGASVKRVAMREPRIIGAGCEKFGIRKAEFGRYAHIWPRRTGGTLNQAPRISFPHFEFRIVRINTPGEAFPLRSFPVAAGRAVWLIDARR